MNKHGRMGTKMSRCLFQAFALLCALAASSAPASSLYFVHTDHLGTPQKITDSGQQVVWEGNPMPFGETEVVVNQIDFHVRFPGQYFDGEAGLHYNYFRDYDPGSGRYVQSDPIGLQGGINTYAYVDGNPLIYTDPLGLAKDAACMATFTVVGGVCGGGAGYVGGGLLGGAGGAALCSPTGPGAAACAVGGAAGGSALGGALGSAAGSAAGYAAGQFFCPDEEQDDACEALYQSILQTCSGLTGRKQFQCFEVARISRDQCYAER